MPQSELIALLVVAVAGAVAAGQLAWKSLRARPSPDEVERSRRIGLNGSGKLADGEIVDIEGANIVFSYSVAGVGYTAAQDVRAIEALLPADRMSVIGPARVKYDPRNPANSIVLCEEWSGCKSSAATR